MKPKKLIALFLFLVLSIQVLPLQRIAAWLSSVQITEEIAHSIESGKIKFRFRRSETSAFTLHSSIQAYSLCLPSIPNLNIISDEALYVRHAR